jgi:hypothetical protein
MLERINRLDRFALKLKCQDCGKPLVLAEMIRQKLLGRDLLQTEPADLRLPGEMTMRTISFGNDVLCWWCAKRAAEPLPWSKLDPNQLLVWTNLLRTMFGVQTEEPLDLLTKRLLTWWRNYKRDPSAAKFICRPGPGVTRDPLRR